MSRNKLLLLIGIGCVGIVLIVCCVISIILIMNRNDDTKSSDGLKGKIENLKPENKKNKYNACELLTKEEAKEILGAEISDEEQENSTSSEKTECQYTTKFESFSDVLASMGVSITTTSKENSKIAFESAKILANDESEIEKVKSLGDEAYILPNVFGTVQLNIVKGDSWILITVFSSGDARQAALDAGKIVVSRID